MAFGDDSDEKYLELHHPDLFPFGRGGFNEQRKKRIFQFGSQSALLHHLLNLNTRQFQKVDFLLPLYGRKTRSDVAKKAFVQSIPPSKSSLHGLTKAEAYGRVSEEDIRLACEYKKGCAKLLASGYRIHKYQLV